MKKLILTITAFLCATFAFAEAESKLFYFYNATDNSYKPFYTEDSSKGNWGGGQGALLGNYDYNGNDTYIYVNVWEFDTSLLSFDQIDSIEFKASSVYQNTGASLVDADLEAFDIEFYSGGTGNYSSDYKGTDLTLIGKADNVSVNDMKDGVLLENLNWNISEEDYITFVIKPDDTVLLPAFNDGGTGASLGMGTGASLTITGSTAAVPEPSTYAAIFGAIALGFVAYRRRK